MNMIVADRITVSVWNGTERVGHLSADLPQGVSSEVLDAVRDELVRLLSRDFPHRAIEIEHDEIAWAS